MTSRSGKNILLRALSIGFGIGAPLVALEVVLRFVPVCDGTYRAPVNEASPIARLAPNRSFIFSQGWNCRMVNEVRTNNEGFVNDADYDSAAAAPLLAVVGDSYVEAFMLPYAQTGAGRAAAYLGDSCRVYTFAMSGAALSQYLAYAEYARERYRPDGLVVVIVGNDFDESLIEYESTPGFHYFSGDADGSLVLRRIDFRPGVLKKIARRSAFFRYVYINLELRALPARVRALFSRTDPRRAWVGQTSAEADPARVAASKRAADAFLDRLPAASGLPAERILLVVDGMRPHLYDDTALASAAGSYFDVMRRYLIERAEPAGYAVADMQVAFREHYAEHGRPFEFPRDGHWNALGHELLFDAIARFDFVAGPRASRRE